MVNKKKRSFLPTINKYQEKIMLLAFIPWAIVLLAMVFSLFIVKNLASQFPHQNFFTTYTQLAFQWHNCIIYGLCSIFIIAVIIIFVLSQKSIEPFPRIIAELDKIIENRSNKIITARPTDELANDLLKRINVLIKFYIENKKP